MLFENLLRTTKNSPIISQLNEFSIFTRKVKQYTRKEFIQLSAAAGAALALSACGAGPEQKKKTVAGNVVKGDTSKGSTPHGEDLHLDLVDKNDNRYDGLRQGFNKRIDKHPQVIAVCAATNEVAAAVNYAREKGLAIAVKSGGHCMEGFSCNDDGMVINLSKMNKVGVLDGNKIKAGPGCTLGNLYDSILPKGLLLPGGSCGTVGLGGLTLGGGYGLFARKHGLTCDHLVDATMVDGNGNIHNTKDDAELFWALKGGGNGNFGVVTEMTFETHVAPTHLQAHYFKARKLTPERAATILQTWMELAALLPESCFSGFVLNGKTLNILITNYDIANTQLPALLNKLAVVMDEFRSSKVNPLATMLRNYYGRPGPLNFRNSSAGYFKGYGDIAGFITLIFEHIMATPGMIYQVNTLGGKINNTTFASGSSYPHRGYDFVSELQAYWDAPGQSQRAADATTEILKLTEANGITRQYVNYCSMQFSNWEYAYYGDNYGRLQAIKRKYDPDNNIRHPQSVKG